MKSVKAVVGLVQKRGRRFFYCECPECGRRWKVPKIVCKCQKERRLKNETHCFAEWQ
jgi:hypothetical protein